MIEADSAVCAFESTPSFGCSLLPTGQEIPLHYQYRDFSSFWSIIQSDSFWATDARFSNDSEEQRFGTNIMRRLLPRDSSAPPNLNEDYIVCFCGEDDKLSQWRGYTAGGGVSIGFDFNAAVPFYVMHEDQENRIGLPSSAYEVVFSQLGRVCYLRPKVKEESDENYNRYCANQIGCATGVKSEDPEAVKAALETLKKCAPFIKHGGFQEEDEYRLVFRNEDGKLSRCTRYRSADSNGIRRPYIVVYPGDPAYDHNPCVVRLCVQDSILPYDKKAKLKAKLKTALGRVKLVDCTELIDKKIIKGNKDLTCFGCTRRHWINGTSVQQTCLYGQICKRNFTFGIHCRENSIIISQGKNQETIYTTVCNVIKSMKLNLFIPVWCEGHLPIRSITVGPCTYQREVVEDIRHYCRHIYWLQHVKVSASSIPFRRVM